MTVSHVHYSTVWQSVMYTTVEYDTQSCACIGAAEHHPTNPVGELPSESGGETTGPAPGED